jgi:cation diffusion facilitator family transporter
MNASDLDNWRHSHSFGQDRKRPGESRTLIVIAITGTMMVVEIIAGLIFGSMALLADGLHMASHAVALSINAMAYVYARKYAHDERYSFGTGKVNTLGGYTGAVLLAVFALVMAWESVARLFDPVAIAFNQAIFVAILGLIVNGISVLILGHQGHSHDHGHEHEHDHGHAHAHHGDDHNLVSAYLHVLADALTSLLAIVALLAAKYFGWIWADPLMGIVGSLLVARWSIGLLKTTSSILLDRQGPSVLRDSIRGAIEDRPEDSVVDLHVWCVGPSIYAAIISIVSSEPQPALHYRERLPNSSKLVHVSIEVHPR